MRVYVCTCNNKLNNMESTFILYCETERKKNLPYSYIEERRRSVWKSVNQRLSLYMVSMSEIITMGELWVWEKVAREAGRGYPLALALNNIRL